MNFPTNWCDDFQETCEELLQDVLLLEAISLRSEQKKTYMANLPPEILEGAYQRVSGYLSQHAADLSLLHQRLS